MDTIESGSDSDESKIIDSEDITEAALIPRLANLIPAISDINKAAFSPKDLRGGPDSDIIVKQIPDHIYALHTAYLYWRKYRKLNDPIPEIIREAVALIKP